MKFNNRNVYISPKATIGKNVKIADNSTIYDNVEIADNTIICDHVTIGEPDHDYYSFKENYINPSTYIGANSLIRSYSLIYSGCNIENNFSTGHRVTIREKTQIGNNCRIGTLCDIQGHVQIGNYTSLHSSVHIGQKSKIGSYVMIYPYVVLTNDPTPPSESIFGVTIDDYSQISACCVVLPKIKIDKHALVAAGSVVSKDVKSYSLVMGSPAKHIKDVREIKSRIDNTPHYPWPLRFERGMPWEGIGYEKWKKHNSEEASA